MIPRAISRGLRGGSNLLVALKFVTGTNVIRGPRPSFCGRGLWGKGVGKLKRKYCCPGVYIYNIHCMHVMYVM